MTRGVKSFSLSILIHALIWAVLLGEIAQEEATGGGGRGTGGAGDNVEIQIVDRGSGAEGACKNFYEGIGITDWGGTVNHVAHGYPAEAAGLREGDQISGDECRGPAGTVAHIIVHRGKDVLHFDIIRARICTDGGEI